MTTTRRCASRGRLYNYDSGTLTKAISYGYDVADRRTALVDGEGVTIGYAWDEGSRLTGVTEGGSARGAYGYDAAGGLTRPGLRERFVHGLGEGRGWAADAGGEHEERRECDLHVRVRA